MISALLYRVAGIDTDLLRQCPKSDRIWAAQLGAWLIISFLLIFIICVYSIRFIPLIENELPARVAVALLVASSVFLFDRALYQSDWFFHDHLGENGAARDQAEFGRGRQAGRLILRLGISLLVAFELSVFLELSMFSEAIKARLEEKNHAANAVAISRIEAFRKEQDTDLASQRAPIEAEENEVLKTTEAMRLAAQPAADSRLLELGKEIDRLEDEQKRISEDIALKQSEVSERNLEVVAETEGTQLDRSHPSMSRGPCVIWGWAAPNLARSVYRSWPNSSVAPASASNATSSSKAQRRSPVTSTPRVKLATSSRTSPLPMPRRQALRPQNENPPPSPLPHHSFEDCHVRTHLEF